MTTNNALNTLLDYGIHPSVQRIAIMDYLLKHHTHPTVDEVYVALHKEIPTLSKTTVYNTLRLFSEHGAAQMLTIDERKVCFDGDVTPHAHFMCKKCGRLFDVRMDSALLQGIRPADAEDFEIDEAHVYFKGTCQDCMNNKEN